MKVEKSYLEKMADKERAEEKTITSEVVAMEIELMLKENYDAKIERLGDCIVINFYNGQDFQLCIDEKK